MDHRRTFVSPFGDNDLLRRMLQPAVPLAERKHAVVNVALDICVVFVWVAGTEHVIPLEIIREQVLPPFLRRRLGSAVVAAVVPD